MKKILVLMVVGVLTLGFSGTSAWGDGAGVNPLLLFSENSSTDLTATIGGLPYGTVVNTGPDNWTWAPPFEAQGGGINGHLPFWFEPGSTTFGNLIETSAPGVEIHSDYSIDLSLVDSFQDGTIVSDALVLLLPDQNKIFYDFQFIDNANASEVPEPATMLLIGSGLLGLWGFRKKFMK